MTTPEINVQLEKLTGAVNTMDARMTGRLDTMAAQMAADATAAKLGLQSTEARVERLDREVDERLTGLRSSLTTDMSELQAKCDAQDKALAKLEAWRSGLAAVSALLLGLAPFIAARLLG